MFIETLTGSADSKILRWWTEVVPYTVGVDIACAKCYSCTPGQVVAVGNKDGRQVVTVQVNDNELIRYGNLKIVNVEYTQDVTTNQDIGVADKFVHIEYCTRWQGNSIWPVRIKKDTFYKQDPTDIVVDVYRLDLNATHDLAANNGRLMATLNAEQEIEFADNRGDI